MRDAFQRAASAQGSQYPGSIEQKKLTLQLGPVRHPWQPRPIWAEISAPIPVDPAKRLRRPIRRNSNLVAVAVPTSWEKVGKKRLVCFAVLLDL